MTESPHPTAADVLHGWSFVHEGRIRTGDKYWNYTERKWFPVLDRSTFLNANPATSMAVFIRKNTGDKQ